VPTVTLPPPHPPGRAPGGGALGDRALEVLREHWRPEGYAVPHAATYPHQWLWDSCFHAIVWARLGEPDRAIAELRSVFAHQGPDGFVPHMTYWSDPGAAKGFWGRPHTSCITQPPMYGHAVAVVSDLGIPVPDDLLDAAHRGLGFLLDRRRHPGGGVRIVHPWESGCDDSPRFDRWCPPSWSPAAWRTAKGDLVAAVARPGAAGDPGPTTSAAFECEPAGFGALVAFNAAELARVGARPRLDGSLAAAAGEVASVLEGRWVPGAFTWADVARQPAAFGGPVAVRTLDALLGALVVTNASQCHAALDQLTDPAAHAGAFGPTGVHRSEPSFDPSRYWRGPTWPQLGYLLWLAARRWERADVADALAWSLAAGAQASGWSEYWHPDTGAPQGAAPQSWTGVVALLGAGDP